MYSLSHLLQYLQNSEISTWCKKKLKNMCTLFTYKHQISGYILKIMLYAILISKCIHLYKNQAPHFFLWIIYTVDL